VKEGSPVKQFDRIAEVQSDKAAVEITSRYDGVIKRLHYAKGQSAMVGAPLVDIEIGGEGEGEAGVDPVKENDKEIQFSEELRDNAIDPPVILPSANNNASIKVLPSVRRIARERGVDLSSIKGTGSHGQITLSDLDSSRSKAPVADSKPTIVPLTAFQKAMVKSMTQSMAIPHFGYSDEMPMDRLLQLRAELVDHFQQHYGLKLTPLPLLIKSLSMALREYPALNAWYRGGDSVTIHPAHNIGVAIDTPHGLSVPVVKNVQAKSLEEITRELAALTEKARQNRLASSDYSQATITLSNIGSIGGTTASPVIPAPTVAIAALGRTQRLPRFDSDNRVTAVSLMPVSWAADHRVVDGATIARFNQHWKAILQSPSAILLPH
jgi:2-oxoisovalerate dehydrogenase E2 component (dihydrolipoyl transacylase)